MQKHACVRVVTIMTKQRIIIIIVLCRKKTLLVKMYSGSKRNMREEGIHHVYI